MKTLKQLLALADTLGPQIADMECYVRELVEDGQLSRLDSAYALGAEHLFGMLRAGIANAIKKAEDAAVVR